MTDIAAFLEVHVYTDGRKVAFFGAPSRPTHLPSSEYVGLINQDPRLETGEYAVDLSRFALRSGARTATWLAVYRGRPDPVLGDRGTYVGAGIWLLDNPAIAVETVLESLRMIVDRVADLMDSANPATVNARLSQELPEYAEGAIQWMRGNAIGGPSDPDLGLIAGDGAPLDSRRAIVRVRNAFGAEALAALSAAMIVRIRNGYSRMLMVQTPDALLPEVSAARGQVFERMFGTSLPLNALNHHALNFSADSALRERDARIKAQSAQQALATEQATLTTVREELDLLRQNSERLRLDLQRNERALVQEREAHRETKAIAHQAEKLRLDNERLQAEHLAYKARVREAGQSPQLMDQIKHRVADAVKPRQGGSNRGGARRVKTSGDVAFYQQHKLVVYGVLGVVLALILGSMGLSYFKDKSAPMTPVKATPDVALPEPIPDQGVLQSTQDPAVADPAATLPDATAPTPAN